MAKKPIPIRPSLEKSKPESSDYKNPLSDDTSDDPPRKSKKKLFSFFMILMIACCAGGYGYIEYKKKKDKEETPIAANDTDDKKEDQLAKANPNAADENSKEDDNSEVIIASNETLKSENNPTQTIPENGDVNLNAAQPVEQKNVDPPVEEEEQITLDFGSDDDSGNEEPQAKPEEKTEADEDLFFNEPDEESTAKSEPESKTVEAESDKGILDSGSLDLTDNELEKSPGKFVAPKVRKPVKEERRQQTPQKKRIRKRKPAKKPPALNSKRTSNNNTRRKPVSRQNNSTANRSRKKTNTSAKIRWKELGNSEYQSPAGLIYGPGSREGHRFKHVLKHAKDQPNRPGKHGVFYAKNRDDVFRLIDEAYQIAKKRGPPDVVVKKDRDRTVYTVNMKRKIGYIGGQVGSDRNHPATYKVRFVLEGKKVITAFPM